jgi:cytochrome c peroxidase
MAWRFVMSKRLFIILAAIVLFSSAIPLTLNAESLDSKQLLGKQIFFAKISNPAVLSCAACHAERVGWTGPRASINKHGSVYRGAIAERFGNRKPPSSGYATLAPRFHFSTADGVLEGGNFWDGRATGWELGNPAADQAKGPFLNPVEQNNPDMKSVCEQIAASDEMASLFEEVWGKDSLNCQKSKVSETYDRIALSIAAYEDSFRAKLVDGTCLTVKPNAYSATFSGMPINLVIRICLRISPTTIWEYHAIRRIRFTEWIKLLWTTVAPSIPKAQHGLIPV